VADGWWSGMSADQIVNWTKEQSARQAYEFAEKTDLTREGYRNALQRAQVAAGATTGSAKIQAQAALQQERMKIEWAKQRMAELEIPQMQIDAWAKAAQIELGRAAQDIQRGELGLSWTQTLAQAGQRPEDYFASADIARGAQARQDVPIFMRALLENQAPLAGTAPGGGGQPTTAATLAEQLMGTGQAGRREEQDRRALEAATAIFQRGGGSVLPGIMESLSTTERNLLQSAGGKGGFDVPSFFESWAKSRPGQASSMLA
jgi:hypothetical protein